MNWLQSISEIYKLELWPDANIISDLKQGYVQSSALEDHMDMELILDELVQLYSPAVNHLVALFEDSSLASVANRTICDLFIKDYDHKFVWSFTQTTLKSGLVILAAMRNKLLGEEGSNRLVDEILHMLFINNGELPNDDESHDLFKLFNRATGVNPFNSTKKEQYETSEWFSENLDILLALENASWQYPIAFKNSGNNSIILVTSSVDGGKVKIIHEGVSSYAEITELCFDWIPTVVSTEDEAQLKIFKGHFDVEPLVQDVDSSLGISVSALITTILRERLPQKTV